MIAGSAAYNLRRDDGGSTSILGCILRTAHATLGSPSTQARVTSKPGQSPDIQVVEAAAFCNALLDCNPTFVEMLWVHYPISVSSFFIRCFPQADRNCCCGKEILIEDELEVKVPRWRAGSELLVAGITRGQ